MPNQFIYMKKSVAVIIVALIIIAGIGIYLLMSSSLGNDQTPNIIDDSSNNQIDIPSGGNTDGSDSGVNVATFSLSGKNFKYSMNGVDNPDLKVKQGDKVRIEFTSSQGFHDWKIDEFSAATERVSDTDSKTVTVEFIADKKGTFEYYCSVGEHRLMG